MNVWQCDAYCDREAMGVGGAVGLRAVGWQVTFTSNGPLLRCPAHWDPAQARRQAGELQATIYSAEDRARLDLLNCAPDCTSADLP